MATIPLGGKPDAGMSDGAGRVFVNMEDLNNIAVIDVVKHEVIASWSITPGKEAAGLGRRRPPAAAVRQWFQRP